MTKSFLGCVPTTWQGMRSSACRYILMRRNANDEVIFRMRSDDMAGDAEQRVPIHIIRGETVMKQITPEITEHTPLLGLAGPMFLEMFLDILLQNVDTLMLSHYSENAVGAVGNANQVMSLLIMMFGIISTATSVVVAQYLGAKRYDQMNKIYTLVFVVNLVFGMLLSLLLVAAKGLCMDLVGVPGEMLPDTLQYIDWVGGFLFLQACYSVMIQILWCNGHAKVGMVVSLTMNITNIAGNYLVLYGPLRYLGLGVTGVALSTVISRVIALVIVITAFSLFGIGRLSLKLLYPFPGKMLLKMVRIGLPSAGESMSYNLYQIVLLSFVNRLGNDAVNARVYCNSLIAFAYVFSGAVATATQIVTGHLVGAGNEDGAYHRVWASLKLAMPVSIGLAIVNWLLSPYTLQLFTNNGHIIQIAFWVMLVDVAIEIGRCLNVTFVYSLKAAGDYMFPLLVGFATMWGIGVVVGYSAGILSGLGVAGIFMGTAADECIRGLIVMRRWKSGKWRGRSIVEQDVEDPYEDFDT